jgi:hypothetical protein
MSVASFRITAQFIGLSYSWHVTNHYRSLVNATPQTLAIPAARGYLIVDEVVERTERTELEKHAEWAHTETANAHDVRVHHVTAQHGQNGVL